MPGLEVLLFASVGKSSISTGGAAAAIAVSAAVGLAAAYLTRRSAGLSPAITVGAAAIAGLVSYHITSGPQNGPVALVLGGLIGGAAWLVQTRRAGKRIPTSETPATVGAPSFVWGIGMFCGSLAFAYCLHLIHVRAFNVSPLDVDHDRNSLLAVGAVAGLLLAMPYLLGQSIHHRPKV